MNKLFMQFLSLANNHGNVTRVNMYDDKYAYIDIEMDGKKVSMSCVIEEKKNED